jgi:hypothetical protein
MLCAQTVQVRRAAERPRRLTARLARQRLFGSGSCLGLGCSRRCTRCMLLRVEEFQLHSQVLTPPLVVAAHERYLYSLNLMPMVLRSLTM